MNFLKLFAAVAIIVSCFNEPSFASVTQEMCKQEDMSEQFGPVRNQGTTGNCYAVVAADLVGHNQGWSPKDRVSVMDLQANFLTVDTAKLWNTLPPEATFTDSRILGGFVTAMEKSRKEKLDLPITQKLDSGWIEPAILAYEQREGGACMESELNSEISSTFVTANSFYGQKATGLAESAIFQLDRYEPLDPLLLPVDPYYPITNFCRDRRSEFRRLNEFSVATLDYQSKALCKNRRPFKPMKLNSIQFNESNKAMIPAGVATALRSKVPLGIGYNAAFLAHGDNHEGPRYGHASTIVGMEWRNGRCEFKLRNSWGLSCEPYHISLRQQCSAGHIWITEEQLIKNTETITALMPQSR